MAYAAQNPNRVSEFTLPSNGCDKSLAGYFAFFKTKITKIGNTFVPSGTENDGHPPSDPPKIPTFMQVLEDAVGKIIKKLTYKILPVNSFANISHQGMK